MAAVVHEVEGRWRDVRGPALAAAAVLAASLVLHVRDPHTSGSYGACPWLLLTGLQCPGCGGLRAVNDLTHGNLLAAASSNLLLVGSLPLLLGWWVRSVVDRWHRVRRPVRLERVYVALAVGLTCALTFTVIRNLPGGAWLSP